MISLLYTAFPGFIRPQICYFVCFSEAGFQEALQELGREIGTLRFLEKSRNAEM